MIKSHLLFEKMSPQLAAEFLDFFYAEQKQAVNVAIQTMAVKRKMRPIFVQRMVPQKRYQWLHRELGRRDNAAISENLVQTWFMETQNAMLCDFMDALGIEHNEKGEVEDMPTEVDAKKLKAGADALLQKYDAEKVVVYLHTILALDMASWPELVTLLVEDERLRFPGQTEPLPELTEAAAAPAPAPAKAKAEPKAKAKPEAEKEPEESSPKPKKAAARKPTAETEEKEAAAAPAKKAAPKKAAATTAANPEKEAKPKAKTKAKPAKSAE